MKRIGLAVAVVVAVAVVAPAVASANSITPMCQTDTGGRQPCSSGWYTTPVVLSWDWSPISGSTPSPSCEAQQQYTVDTDTTVTCSVTWPSPPGLIWPYTVHVELSSPTATVTPARPPDSGGWYNHPVAGAPSATAFSGIASCTSTTYAGPATTAATVSATCTDNAGKSVTVTSAPFAYDTTPPSLSVGATPGDKSVSLTWQTGGDIAPTTAISVRRTPARGHAASDMVYSGDAGGFRDTHVKNGVRYTYTITAWDQAGNASVRSVVITPGPRLLAPAANSRLSAPPTLSWTPVPGATYYNVQLYRGGKVLSRWPTHASLQLARRWRFDGRRYRLKPGRYRWFVWPGFGKRSAGRYGHMVGSGTFVIAR